MSLTSPEKEDLTWTECANILTNSVHVLYAGELFHVGTAGAARGDGRQGARAERATYGRKQGLAGGACAAFSCFGSHARPCLASL